MFGKILKKIDFQKLKKNKKQSKTTQALIFLPEKKLEQERMKILKAIGKLEKYKPKEKCYRAEENVLFPRWRSNFSCNCEPEFYSAQTCKNYEKLS